MCRNISNPRQRLIPTFLNNLQIPHLNPRHGKVRDLKLDSNRLLPRHVHPGTTSTATTLIIRLLSANARQAKVRPHQILSSTMELLNRPNHAILIGQIRHVPHARLETRTIDIGWHGNDNFDIVRHAPTFELRSSFDHVFNPAPAVGFDYGLDPNERLDVRVQSVRHEVELSVGGDERYGPIVLEPCEPNALMKFDILQLYRFPRACLAGPSRGLEH
mmetsp:Transcript_20563/g.44645  ORF Transcript_20563/g.44645 Transcript_20563/m.44645 type:complete len:217 (+) Transcript_20563:228-878(+)